LAQDLPQRGDEETPNAPKIMKKILIVEDDQNIAKSLFIRPKNAGAAAFFQKPHEWEITPPKIHRVTQTNQI
jgi:hypothetical protein